ncbi:MAG: hypothetical protein R2780_08000 [Crocinitomicaceae bacterium]
MNNLLLIELILVATILWIGFVAAISFMEAWLKFRAPGVTLQLGLGIGQLVFKALNKVELVLAFIIGIIGFLTQDSWNGLEYVLYFIALGVLLLQTFWLLPVLDKRIKAHLDNIPLPKSNTHFIYVAAELVKVFSLVMCAVHILRSINAII